MRFSRKTARWITVIAVVLAVVSIQAYLQVVPPVTIVSSGSMQHSDKWQPNVLNTGDMALVKKVTNVSGVITYVQGRNTGFSSFGEYGNVIIYRAITGTLIIHRAILYLSWSDGKPVVEGYHNQSWLAVTGNYILIKDMGYAHRSLYISISDYRNDSGFITAGDYNLGSLNLSYQGQYKAYAAADQDGIFNFYDPPVKLTQILGKAVLDIPWIGLVKLTFSWGLGFQKPYPVPLGSYDYLVLSLGAIFTGLLFPYRRTMNFLRNRK